MDLVLGIDLGTSACKVTLLARNGSTYGTVSIGYPVSAPAPGWSEQNPGAWWDAVCRASSRAMQASGADSGDVRAVALTGQMHTLVVVDGEGAVLRPAILWSDRRADLECDEALAAVPDLPDITSNAVIPAFTLPQLLWIRSNEPETYRAIRHVLMAKDWLRYRMTGRFETDESDASGTAMFNVRERSWSMPIIKRLAIPFAWLPECVTSTTVTGGLTPDAAHALGLAPGTPVFGGAGDQVAQAVANGAIEPGVVGITIGTSGVVVEAQDAPTNGCFCHAVADRWLRLDSMHAAGNSLTWYRDAFEPGRSISDLLADAETIGGNRDGLIFLPFLAGGRDHSISSIPSGFLGFDTGHNRAHFVRAILEGVACELRRMLDSWHVAGTPAPRIRLSGGGSRSALWRQIMADVLDLPVRTTTRGAAEGAAILAAVGLGWWPSVQAACTAPDSTVVMTDPEVPGVVRLRRAYEEYLARVAQLGAPPGRPAVAPNLEIRTDLAAAAAGPGGARSVATQQGAGA